MKLSPSSHPSTPPPSSAKCWRRPRVKDRREVYRGKSLGEGACLFQNSFLRKPWVLSSRFFTDEGWRASPVQSLSPIARMVSFP